MLLETSVTPEYVPNWTEKEALRELIANSLDAKTSGKCEDVIIDKQPNKNTVVITQKNSVALEPKMLSLGYSTSRGDSETIGQFGEGLTMALLVLARERHHVTVYNHDSIWKPLIIESSSFKTPVLGVKIRKRRQQKADNDVSFVIKDVDPETFDYLEVCVLDPSKADRVVDVDEHYQLILGHEFAGKIYVKNILIGEVGNLLFGYHMKDYQLNRDRDLSAVNISSLTNTVLSNALRDAFLNGDRELLIQIIKPILKQAEECSMPADIQPNYTYLFDSSHFRDVFREIYGDVVAVSGPEDIRSLGSIPSKKFANAMLIYRLLNYDDMFRMLLAVERARGERAGSATLSTAVREKLEALEDILEMEVEARDISGMNLKVIDSDHLWISPDFIASNSFDRVVQEAAGAVAEVAFYSYVSAAGWGFDVAVRMQRYAYLYMDHTIGDTKVELTDLMSAI